MGASASSAAYAGTANEPLILAVRRRPQSERRASCRFLGGS